ncbi:MAG: diaminopimelate epimerase [Actinobacteria bacterium]|nr:diaminopimelate epimerase [Actinomycetota bacterium]
MDFVKMHGLGNDFVVLRGPFEPTAAEVAGWCDRRRGIGADGVLVVSPLEAGLIGMEYWNADGSPAEMCGNGLRCVARYAVDAGMVSGPDFVVQTAVGRRPVTVRDDGSVRALLGTVTAAGVGPLEVAGYHLDPIRVGNPHAVAFVSDCYSTPVDAVGPIVEGDPHFPERTNVEFATVVSPDRIALRVWERGVGETLACGSGAAATAAMAHQKGLTDARVTVELPGGSLIVEVTDEGVWIDGPAVAVFSGSI